MTIIDLQVHAYEANTAKRRHSVPNWPDHVTGDEMVAAMDKVGVDGAIFISAFSMYRYDASYAVDVQRAHPGRLASSSRSTQTIRRWPMSSPTGRRRRAQSASASMMTKEAKREPNDPPRPDPRAAVRHDFPVNMLCWGNVDAGTR
jgi:hypothetical protein